MGRNTLKMQSDSVMKGLAYGAVASMIGDLVTMPVDVTKTRLQISGEGGKRLYTGMVDCMMKTARAEGVPALWKGLEPALWRQCFYGSLRYGIDGSSVRSSQSLARRECEGCTKVLAPTW